MADGRGAQDIFSASSSPSSHLGPDTRKKMTGTLSSIHQPPIEFHLDLWYDGDISSGSAQMPADPSPERGSD